MKKVFSAAALFVALALCACAAPSAETNVPADETPPEDIPAELAKTAAPPELSAKYMKEPPALQVSFGDSSVSVNPFGYEWTETLPDGTAATAIACGMHPLDKAFEHKTLYIAYATENDVFVKLSFEAEPESVSLSVWNASDVGNVSAAPEKKELSDMTFTLPQGVFILEASASFGKSGSAEYAFCVDFSPELCGLPPAPVDAPPYVPPDSAAR